VLYASSRVSRAGSWATNARNSANAAVCLALHHNLVFLGLARTCSCELAESDQHGSFVQMLYHEASVQENGKPLRALLIKL